MSRSHFSLRALLVTLALLVSAAPVAALDVVATTGSMAMLAREVGGDAVSVSQLAPNDRDAHTLQARPSMIRALRRAELVVAVGADLEVGWLPAAISSAHNPRIYPGRDGYFEAAAQVPLLEVGGPADRGRGDVHPVGNPHVALDPKRMALVALALADRLGQLDAENKSDFRARASRFWELIHAQLPAWQARAIDAPGVLSYHKDLTYLLARFDVVDLGTIEPLPGIPPSGRHLRELVRSLSDKRGVLLHADYQAHRSIDQLAKRLGWPRRGLPIELEEGALGRDYIAFISSWVDAVALTDER